MIKSRNEIESAITKYLKEVFGDKQKRESIIEFLTAKGLTKGYVTKMLNLNQPTDIWSDIDLGIMMLAIDDIKGLDITEYYTEKEIDVFLNYAIVSKKSVDEPIIFENAFPIGYFSENETPNEFMVAQVSIQAIADLFKERKVGYNPDLQRQLLITLTKKGEVIEKINVQSGKTNAIAEKTLQRKMFANAIVINVMKTGLETVKYNNDSHRLIIENDEQTEVFIIDGFHRVSGYIKALQKEENINFYIPVIVSIFDRQMASQTISDINEQLPISRGKAKMLNTANPFMEITKKINRFGTEETNEMFNKLAEDYNELKIKKEKICTYETLSEAIKYNFFNDSSKVTARNIDNTTEFLIKAFNELIGLLKDKLDTDDIKDIKTKGVYLENNTIIGYVALFSNIQHLEDWKKALGKTINKIDFSNSNDDWKQLEVSSNRLKKTIIKKISEYFIERCEK